MSDYRCCETCGNLKCKNSAVAIHYDQCIESGYKEYWLPKYIWLGMENDTDEVIDDTCRQMDILLEYERKKNDELLRRM